MVTLNEAIDLIQKSVNDYVIENQKIIPTSVYENQEKLDHIIDVGASIMRTKWDVGYAGGSFAQAVVANNLRQTFGYADITCRECLHFFVVMINNLDMPSKVWEYKKSLQVAMA